MSEQVYHPNHYNKNGKKECWTEMIDKFGPDATAVFDCMNAFKYKYRAGEKEGNSKEQDIAKMKNYMAHAHSIVCSNIKTRQETNDLYLAMVKEIGNDKN